MQSKQKPKNNGKQQLGQLLSQFDELGKQLGQKYVELINCVKQNKIDKEQVKAAFIKSGKTEGAAAAETAKVFRFVRPYKDIEDFLTGNPTIADFREFQQGLMLKLRPKVKKQKAVK